MAWLDQLVLINFYFNQIVNLPETQCPPNDAHLDKRGLWSKEMSRRGWGVDKTLKKGPITSYYLQVFEHLESSKISFLPGSCRMNQMVRLPRFRTNWRWSPLYLLICVCALTWNTFLCERESKHSCYGDRKADVKRFLLSDPNHMMSTPRSRGVWPLSYGQGKSKRTSKALCPINLDPAFNFFTATLHQ